MSRALLGCWLGLGCEDLKGELKVAFTCVIQLFAIFREDLKGELKAVVLRQNRSLFLCQVLEDLKGELKEQHTLQFLGGLYEREDLKGELKAKKARMPNNHRIL